MKSSGFVSRLNAGHRQPACQSPVKVLVFDEDFFALQWAAGLIARDPRTHLLGAAETLKMALDLIREKDEEAHIGKPEMIVVSMDNSYSETSPAELVEKIRAAAPEAKLVCLAKAPEADLVQAAIDARAEAFFLKNEVRMALVPALMRVAHGIFLVSAGVEPVLISLQIPRRQQIKQLQPWKPNPFLTPQLTTAFRMRVLYGLRAPTAAEEMTLEPGTIEKYTGRSYDILENNYWAEDADFKSVAMAELQPEERAFIWYTALPKR